MKTFKVFTVFAAVVLLLLSAGCDSAKKVEDQGSSTAQQNEAKQPPVDKTAKNDKKTPAATVVTVYFPNADGTKLIAVSKNIKAGDDKYLGAVQALSEEPADKKLTAVMPKNTKINSVKVDKGIAYVDFSKEFVKNFTGGSTGEIMLVGSIVNTLTEHAEIKSVQILVDSKKIDTLAGHMDLSEPIKRMKDLLKN